MGSVIDMFPEKVSASNSVEHTISKLDFWRGRNEIISRDFHSFSVYQKQETLETVLDINNKLYQLILELKGEI